MAQLKLPKNCFSHRPKENRNDTYDTWENTPNHPIWGVWMLLGLILLFIIASLLDVSHVEPMKVKDEQSNPHLFIGERAQRFLDKLTDLGPRVTGSDINEIQAVEVLINETKSILENINMHQQVDYQLREFSGLYYYEPTEPYVYKGIQDLIVKFSGLGINTSAIIVNAHFDSVPTSPGGMDNGFMCSVMMEIIRKLATTSERFLNDIVFVFNGGEEPGLLGAHGFITQHEWAKNGKVIINLDAAGVGDREMLFQSGPKHAWLTEYYSQTPRPNGQAMGEEVFQAKLVPSDTDYRVFRDIGNMYGYDFAIATNGYRHHSRLDGFAHIPLEAYQHVGENIHSLIKALGNAEEIYDDSDNDEKVIFFDVFGLFMVTYTETVAMVLNIVTILFSVITAFLAFYIHGVLNFSMKNAKYFGITIGGIIFSWCLMFGAVYFLAFILDTLNSTMSWFNSQWMLVGLYGTWGILFVSIPWMLISKYAQLPKINLQEKAQIQMHITRLIWTILLLAGTVLGIRSVYIISVCVFFNSVAVTLVLAFRQQAKCSAWKIIYIIQIIPNLFVFYLARIILSIFIPIIGRSGADSNPDLLIGLVTMFLILLVVSYCLPFVITISESVFSTICLLFLVFLLFIIFAFTSVGFPYSADSENPTPQRYTVYHVNRTMHDSSGGVTYRDSGFYSVNFDRNSPESVSDIVTEFKMAENINQYNCRTILYCGLPTDYARDLKSLSYGSWIKVDEFPAVDIIPTLELLNKKTYSKFIEFEFLLKGPDRIGISISPIKGAKLINTTLLQEVPSEPIQWEGRNTYFVNFVTGKGQHELPFTVLLQKSTNEKETLTIGVTGKYLHDIKPTTKYQNFLKKFPSWTVVAPHLSIFESWIY